MEPLNSKILNSFAKQWRLDPSKLKLLERRNSYFYASERSVLRISPLKGWSLEEIEAEAEWLNYSAHRGLSVAMPLHSIQQKVFSEIDAYIAVNFDRIRGRCINPQKEAEFGTNKYL